MDPAFHSLSFLRRAGCAAWLAACLAAVPAHALAPASDNAVAWLPAAADADVERAFAQARAQGKPVLLYWGATWCPPCNQLKATLFNRQDFAAQAKSFVAVEVDGDRPGAQKLGTRFKVRGYPTMILFAPDGTELTRLPGEADAPQVLAALQAGLAGGRPVRAVLADARAGRPLSAGEWRSLAFYSWDTDQAQLATEAERGRLLGDLAARATAGSADEETRTRLWLKALAAPGAREALRPDTALRARVDQVLVDPARTRAQMDVLVNWSDDIAQALAADGSSLPARFDTALARLQDDASLSRADRASALLERVELARLGQPKEAVHPRLPEPLLREVRDFSARMDREISNGYERQAVITTVVDVLGRAGLWNESDALLKANLAKSHAPYYLMSQLGSNARKQGRKDEALRWYAQAFERSEGPATRLQWGASYLTALVELAPQDAAAIEKTAARLFGEAAQDEAAFHERSARSLQRVGTQLVAWNAGGAHAGALRRLQAQLDPLCRRLDTADGQRAACEALLKPAAGARPA